MMPNMMPKVGQGAHDRVFYNTGHGHLGWTLSAVTAEMVADRVTASFAGRSARNMPLTQARKEAA